MACRPFTVVCLAGLVLAGTGVAAAEPNFSQYPGFAEYFAENPPAGVANATEQALLRRPVFHRNLACVRQGIAGCTLE